MLLTSFAFINQISFLAFFDMNYLFAFSYSSFTFSNKKLLTNFAMQLLIFFFYPLNREVFGLLNFALCLCRRWWAQMEEVIIWLLRNQVFLIFALSSLRTLVGSNGLGPSTSRLSGVCSNQLSYEPVLVEVIGFEPMTPCLQGRCSTS